MKKHTTQKRGKSWIASLVLLALLGLFGLFAAPVGLQAEGEDVLFVEDTLELDGVAGAGFKYPLKLQAGGAGAEKVKLSVEALFAQEHPGQTILDDDVKFSATEFDMGPDSPRTVMLAIETLPELPDTYTGVVELRSGDPPTLQDSVPVTLTVDYAFGELHIADADDGQLTISGNGGSLSGRFRITSEGQAASNVSLVVSDVLEREDGLESIDAGALSMDPDPISIRKDDSDFIILSITGTVAPGTYRGQVLLQQENQPQELAQDFSLTVTVLPFTKLKIDDKEEGEIQIEGYSDDLKEQIRIEAVDRAASGVSLFLSENLTRTDGQPETIGAGKVTMSPNIVPSIKTGDWEHVTLAVDGSDVPPGVYTGTVYFRQTHQLKKDAQPFTLKVTVASKPEIELPQGTAYTTEAVHCGGWLGLVDCWLAQHLLPADRRQSSVKVQVMNPDDEDPVSIYDVQQSISYYGPRNAPVDTALLETSEERVDIGPGETQGISVNIPSDGIVPGQYKGSLTLKLKDRLDRSLAANDETVTVDIKVRKGPTLAIVLILLGILGGRLIQELGSDRGKLLSLWYRLRGRIQPVLDDLLQQTNSKEQKDWIEKDIQLIIDAFDAIRHDIYDEKLEGLEKKLRDLSERPLRLLRFHRLQADIKKACKEAELTDEDSKRLTDDAAKKLWTRIHQGDATALNVTNEINAIVGYAGGLKELRELENNLSNLKLTPEAIGVLKAKLHKARTALVGGDVKTANDLQDNARRAASFLPKVIALEKKVEKDLAGHPAVQRNLIQRFLGNARQEALNFDFEDARWWLREARATLAILEQDLRKQVKGVRPMFPGLGVGIGDLDDLLAMPQSVLALPKGQILPKEYGLSVRSLWERFKVWWEQFSQKAGVELSLALHPLLGWIVLFITALVGFQVLYVAKSPTFGADPINDYLALLLWGFSSDVAGATIPKLAQTLKTTLESA